MIKTKKVRYKIVGFGVDFKVVNLYFDLHHCNSLELKTLDKQISELRTNYVSSKFGYHLIHSAKSLNVWFSEEGTIAKDIKAILDDFVSNTALCLLYTEDEKDQYRFLSALLLKYIDAEGADLELY